MSSAPGPSRHSRNACSVLAYHFLVVPLRHSFSSPSPNSGVQPDEGGHRVSALALLGVEPEARLVFLDCMGEVRAEAVR